MATAATTTTTTITNPLYRLAAVPKKGNGLIAVSPITPSTPILTIENPLLAILNDASLSQHCYACLLPLAATAPSPPVPCRTCTTVTFCSLPCRRASPHRRECPLLLRADEALGTPTRALIAVMVAVAAKPAGEERAAAVAELVALAHHREGLAQHDQEALSDLILQALMACKLAGMETDVEREWALRIACVLRANAFMLTSEMEQDLGVLFDPLLSKANHSCSPNAFVSVTGRSVSIRCLRPIAAGEEILISYVDAHLPREERRRRLLDQYRFSCDCSVCERDLDTYSLAALTFEQDSSFREEWGTFAYSPDELLDAATRYARSSTKKQKTELAGEYPYFLVEHTATLPTPAEQYHFLREQLLLTAGTDSSSTAASGTHAAAAAAAAAAYPVSHHLQTLYTLNLTQHRTGPSTILLLHHTSRILPFQHPSPYDPARASAYLALATLLHASASDASPRGLRATASKLGCEDAVKAIIHAELPLFVLALLRLAEWWAVRGQGEGSRFVSVVRGRIAEVLAARRGGDGRVGGAVDGAESSGGDAEVWESREVMRDRFRRLAALGTWENVLRVCFDEAREEPIS